MDWIVRTATHNDVPALNALIEQSVRGLQSNDYSPEQIAGALNHTLGLDTQLIADATYFAVTTIEQPDRIIGCGGWSYRRTTFGSDHANERDASPLDPTTEAAKIRAIFVHPDFARRGLGTLILQHCEQAAQSAGFRAFEMGSTLTGVPLYTLKGYRETQRIEVPLPNGAALPIVLMRKVASQQDALRH
jgi:GNAT superfamily N-acetyltransferase